MARDVWRVFSNVSYLPRLEALLLHLNCNAVIYDLDLARDSGMLLFQTLCKMVGKEGDVTLIVRWLGFGFVCLSIVQVTPSIL